MAALLMEAAAAPLSECNAVVVLEGELGLREARRLHDELRQAEAVDGEVRVDLAGVEAIDVAAIQILHAFQCTCGLQGVRVVRVSGVRAEVARYAADAGAAGAGCGRICGHAACVLEGQ